MVAQVSQMVKNLPVIQETQVLSLGWVDYPGERNEPHFSIIAWRIPWTEEPGALQSLGHKELDTTEQLTLPYKDLVPASHISLEIQLKVRDCLRKNENFHPEEGLQLRKP